MGDILDEMDRDLSDDTQGALEAAAARFGLRKTSGQRSPSHNAAVGGAAHSYHLSGQADDFAGTSESMKAFHEYVKAGYGDKLNEVIHGSGDHRDHVHVAWKPQQKSSVLDEMDRELGAGKKTAPVAPKSAAPQAKAPARSSILDEMDADLSKPTKTIAGKPLTPEQEQVQGTLDELQTNQHVVPENMPAALRRGAQGEPLTWDGYPAIRNSDGSITTEKSITVTDPKINGGKPTNIPSVWGGKELSQSQAILQAAKSKQSFASFASIDEAVKAAQERSAQKGQELDAQNVSAGSQITPIPPSPSLSAPFQPAANALFQTGPSPIEKVMQSANVSPEQAKDFLASPHAAKVADQINPMPQMDPAVMADMAQKIQAGPPAQSLTIAGVTPDDSPEQLKQKVLETIYGKGQIPEGAEFGFKVPHDYVKQHVSKDGVLEVQIPAEDWAHYQSLKPSLPYEATHGGIHEGAFEVPEGAQALQHPEDSRDALQVLEDALNTRLKGIRTLVSGPQETIGHVMNAPQALAKDATPEMKRIVGEQADVDAEMKRLHSKIMQEDTTEGPDWDQYHALQVKRDRLAGQLEVASRPENGIGNRVLEGAANIEEQGLQPGLAKEIVKGAGNAAGALGVGAASGPFAPLVLGGLHATERIGQGASTGKALGEGLVSAASMGAMGKAAGAIDKTALGYLAKLGGRTLANTTIGVGSQMFEGGNVSLKTPKDRQAFITGRIFDVGWALLHSPQGHGLTDEQAAAKATDQITRELSKGGEHAKEVRGDSRPAGTEGRTGEAGQNQRGQDIQRNSTSRSEAGNREEGQVNADQTINAETVHKPAVEAKTQTETKRVAQAGDTVNYTGGKTATVESVEGNKATLRLADGRRVVTAPAESLDIVARAQQPLAPDNAPSLTSERVMGGSERRVTAGQPPEGTPERRGLVERARGKLADVISPEQAKERRGAQRAAETDTLTGLGNQSAWLKAKGAAEADPNLSIITSDINNQKAKNAAHGHEAGDESIKRQADAMRQAAAEFGETRVMRSGLGDEVSAIVPKEKAEAISRRAEEIFGEEMLPNNLKVSLSADHGETFKAAETALNARKEARKGVGGSFRPETPAVAPQEPVKPTKLYHGSAQERTELKPGSMVTNDPVWAAGYTTKVHPDLTEDFTGRVHEVELAAQKPLIVEGHLETAEQKLITLGTEALGREPRSLEEAANAVHGKFGYDAVLAQNKGETVGAIPLTAVPVGRTQHPVDVIRATTGRVPENLQKAVARHEAALPPTEQGAKPTEEPLYHGSLARGLTELTREQAGQTFGAGPYGKGIWATPDRAQAETYTKRGDQSGAVYQVSASPKNRFDLTTPEIAENHRGAIVNQLRKAGLETKGVERAKTTEDLYKQLGYAVGSDANGKYYGDANAVLRDAGIDALKTDWGTALLGDRYEVREHVIPNDEASPSAEQGAKPAEPAARVPKFDGKTGEPLPPKPVEASKEATYYASGEATRNGLRYVSETPRVAAQYAEGGKFGRTGATLQEYQGRLNTFDATKATPEQTAQILGKVNLQYIEPDGHLSFQSFEYAPEPVIQRLRDAGFDSIKLSEGTEGTSIAVLPESHEKLQPKTAIPPAGQPETVEPPSEPTSPKNAVTEAERAARNLPPVEKQAYQAIGESFLTGKASVDSGETDPRTIAASVAKKPRPLSATEVGALGYDRAKLINEHKQALDAIGKAVDAGKDVEIQNARDRLARVESDLDLNDQALQKGGREQSAAFNARKMLVKDDYSLARTIQRVKAATGRDITPEARGKLEGLTKELEAMESKLADSEGRTKQAEDKIKEMEAAVAVKEMERANKRTRRAQTKTDLDAEFADLMKQMQSGAGVRGGGEKGAVTIDPELAKIIGKLAVNRVKAGYNTVGGLVDHLYDNLKGHVDGLTKRDVRDAISGYGKTAHPNKDAVVAQLRDLKQQARSVSALEDIESGQRPAKSGFQREPPTPEAAALQKQVADAMKVAGFVAPKNPATARKAYQKRLTEQIADLQSQVDSGQFKGPKPRIKPTYDAETIKLQRERDVLRHQIDQTIESQKRSSLLQTASAMRKAGLLTGIKTHARNLGGNLGYAAFDEVSRIPGSLVDMVMSVGTKRRTLTGISPSAELDSLAKAATVGGREAMEILKHGITAEEAGKLQLHKELSSGSKIIDVATNSVFRILGAEDRLFYNGHLRRNILDRARAQALTERRTNKSVDVAARTKELAGNPSEQLQADAKHDALVATFNNNNKLSDMIQSGRSKIGDVGNFALDLVMPFDRTPTNILMRMVEASPAGFVKNGGQIVKAIVKKSFTEADQRAFAQTFGRATIGTGLIALGYKLAAMRLATGPSDDEPSKRSRDVAAGRSPMAIRAPGGDWHQIGAFSPLGNLVAVGAGLYREENQSIKDVSKRPAKMAAIATKTLLEQPMLKGTSDIIDAIKQPGTASEKAARTAASFVPTGLADIAGVADSKRREAHGIGQQFANRLPGLRNTLPEATDALGRPLEQRRTAAIDPTLTSTAKERTDPVDKELVRLDVGVSKVAKKPGEDEKLYRIRAQKTGERLYNVLNLTVRSAGYQRMTKEQQKDRLDDLIKEIHRDSQPLPQRDAAGRLLRP